ncbi:antitoxin HicB [Corynebacterium poyangense]|uniref:antitoxin HicB n=1 Tax=Corynebacterium poyangense TaxID=2684405 RepID=UPI001CCAF943|nr:antitoxin HicB [Corynebacterium poyangense]
MTEFPSLSWLDTGRQQAERGLLDLIAEVVEDMESSSEVVPTPWVAVTVHRHHYIAG